jgi:hypothetical protein
VLAGQLFDIARASDVHLRAVDVPLREVLLQLCILNPFWQVHDRGLFDLKQRMHRLYRIKRAKNPDLI